MSDFILFDTSVLIDNLRTARHSQRIAERPGIARNSSVVLAELWRGATTAAEWKFLKELANSRPVLTPTENSWLESGEILSRIQKDRGFKPRKLRDLHFDVLIALTARTHGALLITSNRADFELIRQYRDFYLEVW
ncbi:MAG: PIN domain-containing protein [Terracidiphilus sp.]|jgi:predicted nucleic acid-binding protein